MVSSGNAHEDGAARPPAAASGLLSDGWYVGPPGAGAAARSEGDGGGEENDDNNDNNDLDGLDGGDVDANKHYPVVVAFFEQRLMEVAQQTAAQQVATHTHSSPVTTRLQDCLPPYHLATITPDPDL